MLIAAATPSKNAMREAAPPEDGSIGRGIAGMSGAGIEPGVVDPSVIGAPPGFPDPSRNWT